MLLHHIAQFQVLCDLFEHIVDDALPELIASGLHRRETNCIPIGHGSLLYLAKIRSQSS